MNELEKNIDETKKFIDELEGLYGKKQEIFNHLLSIEKKVIHLWDQTYLKLYVRAMDCSVYLAQIIFMNRYREDEKRLNRKPITFQKLQDTAKKYFTAIIIEMGENKSTDQFYTLGKFTSKTTTDPVYFTDKEAIYYLSDIMRHDFKLPDSNLDKVLKYALSLKGAFYSLAYGKYIPVSITFKAFETLRDIENIIKESAFPLISIEEVREKQREIASTTQKTLLKIKAHSLYPEIEKILASNKKLSKKNSEIRKIILQMNIKGVESEKTAIKYTRML